MRKAIVFLLISMITIPIMAQEKSGMGFFGAPLIKFSQLNKKIGFLPGARIGANLKSGKHNFVVGVSGYYLVNDIDTKHIRGANYKYYSGGLDLAYLRPIPNKNNLHWSISLFLGSGKLAYDDPKNLYASTWATWEDGIYVIEPGINFLVDEKNYSRWEFGVGYRFVTGIDHVGVKQSDVSGPSINVILNLGKF